MLMNSYQIPIVNIDWVKECEKKHAQLPMEPYSLQMPHVAREVNKPSTDTLFQKLSTPHIPQLNDILNQRFSNMKAEPSTSSSKEEEEDTTQETDSEMDDNDGEDIGLAPGFNNTKYECFRPTPYRPRYNKQLVSYLELLEEQRELNQEDKNALSYRHAIAAMKAYPREIRSSKEAAKIIGIGKKMTELVRLYLQTGTIPEASELLHDEKFLTLRLFNKVFGVGAATAKIWWDMGYRTLQEVLDNAKLTSIVRLGIQLLPDLIQKMSREDVEELVALIDREVAALNVEGFVKPVGGYRRGKIENGDLDIIISSHREDGTVGLLRNLTARLEQKGLIQHILWFSADRPKKDVSGEDNTIRKKKRAMDDLEKCFCAFLQPSKSILRQVDLIVATRTEYPTAVLGWTGSRQYERSLRDYAKKEKQLSVNSNGIFTDTAPKKRINVQSEEEAYELLDLPFMDPVMRNC
ncbi:uncharacterized protein BYT42DRAFT_567744 [Radiomyces spectabilis]|uniref:uncharacterized protein n=1 Tax=Radiomyces spectabilis TaxID=64574 RepID=UPI002220BE6A|nr:uncharacterized protein BYT42DRAFT_567744 [Radiomyces spectabilis]KAI8379149.1 hypothetical protein BYT42DRAFT_567744 [Radiomyces spectabilis]